MCSDRRLRRTTRQKKTFRPENKINCAENKSGADPGVPMAFPGFGTRLPPDHRRDSWMTIRVRRRSTRAPARDAPPGPGLAPARGRRAPPPRNPLRAFSSGQSACACPFRRPHRGAPRRASVFLIPYPIHAILTPRQIAPRRPARHRQHIHTYHTTNTPTRTTDRQRHETRARARARAARRMLDQIVGAASQSQRQRPKPNPSGPNQIGGEGDPHRRSQSGRQTRSNLTPLPNRMGRNRIEIPPPSVGGIPSRRPGWGRGQFDPGLAGRRGGCFRARVVCPADRPADRLDRSQARSRLDLGFSAPGVASRARALAGARG